MKGTIWFLLIYEDDPNYKLYVENLEESFDYVKIRHDKDIVEETGELKKPHVHYLLKTNQMSIARVSEISRVPMNYIKVRTDYAFAFRYLLHLDQPDKTRYKETELEGYQLKERLRKYVECDREEAVITDILEIIEYHKAHGSATKHLLNDILRSGYWGYWKQSQSTFLMLWKE